MSTKYFYKLPYKESDPLVKQRRCKTCKEICKINYLENKNTCKKCYVVNYSKKRCNKCYLLKPISGFFKNSNNKDGYKSKCKDCQGESKNTLEKRGTYYKWSSNKNRINFYNAKNKAQKFNAIKFDYYREIRDIYNNCPLNQVVEYIYPINNVSLCGLYVPWNLQYSSK